MDKQSLFYGLLFLLLASMGQETFAMKWTKQQWANGFRLGMKTLNYAGVMGCAAYFLRKKYYETDAKIYIAKGCTARVKLLETEKYVLNILHRTYPELKNTPIKVVYSPFRDLPWSTCFHNGTHYLLVPCTDPDLQKAISYNNAGTLYRGYIAFTNSLVSMIGVSIPVFELSGSAMTPTTLDAWNQIIMHEGSHILRNDDKNTNRLIFLLPAAVIYGMNKVKTTLGFTSFLSTHPVIGNLVKGLGYIPSLPIKLATCALFLIPYKNWCEYRADQDAIKHSQNPKELRAISSLHENLPTEQPSNLREKVQMLLDPHPADKTRAAYYAEAAQKLEEKQAQQPASKD